MEKPKEMSTEDWEAFLQPAPIESMVPEDDLECEHMDPEEPKKPKSAAILNLIPRLRSKGDWKKDLLRGEDGGPLKTPKNVALFLENSEITDGCLAYDRFNEKPIWRRVPPRTPNISPGDGLDRGHYPEVQDILFRLGLGKCTKEVCYDGMMLCAMKNPFDPLQDYLSGLRWDGTPRIAEWLWAHAGVQEPASIEAGRLWLISAVARAMNPGCQADHCLILQGPQGVRKSTALKALAGPEWYHELVAIDRDSRMSCSGKWIVEIAELDAFRGRDVSQIKQFITTAVDRFRPPYGTSALSFPRHFVFAGTTNDSCYLRDTTGNRRFWLASTNSIDVESIERDRDQLWAEALDEYRRGARWWADKALSFSLAETAAASQVVDPWEDVIEELVGCHHGDFIASKEIYEKLELEAARRSGHDESRIRAIMLRLGWTRHRTNIARGWKRPLLSSQ